MALPEPIGALHETVAVVVVTLFEGLTKRPGADAVNTALEVALPDDCASEALVTMLNV